MRNSTLLATLAATLGLSSSASFASSGLSSHRVSRFVKSKPAAENKHTIGRYQDKTKISQRINAAIVWNQSLEKNIRRTKSGKMIVRYVPKPNSLTLGNKNA